MQERDYLRLHIEIVDRILREGGEDLGRTIHESTNEVRHAEHYLRKCTGYYHIQPK